MCWCTICPPSSPHLTPQPRENYEFPPRLPHTAKPLRCYALRCCLKTEIFKNRPHIFPPPLPSPSRERRHSKSPAASNTVKSRVRRRRPCYESDRIWKRGRANPHFPHHTTVRHALPVENRLPHPQTNEDQRLHPSVAEELIMRGSTPTHIQPRGGASRVPIELLRTISGRIGENIRSGEGAKENSRRSTMGSNKVTSV